MPKDDATSVHSVTTAREPLSQSQILRQRKYLIGMTIRTLCFIGSILTHGPLRWILFFGAFILPYFSVVIANAGRERMDLDIDERPTVDVLTSFPAELNSSPHIIDESK